MRSAESPHTRAEIVNLDHRLPAEWRSRAQSAVPHREPGDRPVAAPPAAGRQLPSLRVTLILTVEDTDILKARWAILHACGDAVETLQCTRIRGTSRVRLRVHLEDRVAAQTVQHVMHCLTAGEFGRVVVL